MREGKRTSLWTPAKLKPTLFTANTLHNRLFSEPPTVYRGKHIVSRPFHCSYLKVNKISESEGIKKVQCAYHMLFSRNYQNYSMLVETTACQSWRIFWDTVYYRSHHSCLAINSVPRCNNDILCLHPIIVCKQYDTTSHDQQLLSVLSVTLVTDPRNESAPVGAYWGALL